MVKYRVPSTCEHGGFDGAAAGRDIARALAADDEVRAAAAAAAAPSAAAGIAGARSHAASSRPASGS